MVFPQVEMSPEEKRKFQEDLRFWIWEAIREMGVTESLGKGLTEDELRLAMEEPLEDIKEHRGEKKSWSPYKLGDRISAMTMKAKDERKRIEQDPAIRPDSTHVASSGDLRRLGAHSSVLKAADCLWGSPERAAMFLEYAYDIWDRKVVWDSEKIDQPPPLRDWHRWMEEWREKNEERRKRAAFG